MIITLFDFDDSCFHWFAHDLAVAIYHLPKAANQSEHDKNAHRFLRALLRGYRRVAPIKQTEIDKIPLFLKWRDLVVYGFFYKALDIEALPAWLRENFVAMRQRIEAGRPVADISGVE